MWKSTINRLLGIFWPHRCVSCGQDSEPEILCEPCMVTLVPGSEACCPRCGRVYLLEGADGGHQLCGKCLQGSPPWQRARAAYAYGGPLRDAICSWKNKPDCTLGPHLARLMLKQAPRCGWNTLSSETVVIPIPSPRAHGFRRGFQPSGVLGLTLARSLELPFRPTLLRLSDQVSGAKGMSKSERERRHRNALRVKGSAIAGKGILLVDDVMTTGATVTAAAQACQRAGATKIDVAVLAGTPRD